MLRSLKVAKVHLPRVQLAYQQKFSTQLKLAETLKLSRQTVSSFLNGRPVDRLNFIEISGQLNMDWKSIAEFKSSQVDTDEMPDCPHFYGRSHELQQLRTWIFQDKCRLIAVLGMGGIGKTVLTGKFVEEIVDDFDYIIWRNLHEAAPIKDFLIDIIRFLAKKEEVNKINTETSSALIMQLIKYLRSNRCLIVLDNAETILRQGNNAGNFAEDYEEYGKLLRRVGEIPHNSCFLVTSREKPLIIQANEGKRSPVHSLQLGGLSEEDGAHLLADKGLTFDQSSLLVKKLIHNCSGNPLMLKIVASTIEIAFSGSIENFLNEGTLVSNGVNDLINQQFSRLTNLEKEIMYWFVIEQEPVSIAEIQKYNLCRFSISEIQESIKSLLHRSLIESHTPLLFTLQPVIMEYVTNGLIEDIFQEIRYEELNILKTHSLIKAQTKDYLREKQVRIILNPILEKLLSFFDNSRNLHNHLHQMLDKLRQSSSTDLGYTCGNILNLLCHSGAELTNYNLSKLTIRQAYFQGKELRNVDFSQSEIVDSVFTETLETILSLSFSPDSEFLATADANGEICLWHVGTGKRHLVCKGHTDWVRSVSFSPDGLTLVSGSGDKTIKLWDSRTGHCQLTFKGHSERIRSVKFSPDGKFIISGGLDRSVRIWDVKTGQCIRNFLDHSNSIRSVVFSPDGQFIASSGEDQIIKIREIKTGTIVRALTGHQKSVRSIAFSPDGKLLASSSTDKTVRIWDYQSGICLKVLEGHEDGVRLVRFSPDSSSIASSSDDKTVRIWDISTGECVNILQGHTHWVRCIAFSPNGHILASGGADRMVKLWDTKTGQCIRTLRGYTNWIRSVVFSPDGEVLASGNADQQVRLWNTRTGKLIRTVSVLSGWVQSVAYSPDGKLLATGSSDPVIKLCNLTSNTCQPLKGHRNRVMSVAFSPDGYTLASGSDDCTIRLWNVSTSECLEILEGHSDRVNSVSFSPDSCLIASASEDETIAIWDVRTGVQIASLKGHYNRVRTVAFSCDGKIIASGGSDKTIKLWDTTTNECIRTLEGHTHQIRSLSFSPNKNLLVSASSDKTLKVWDIVTGECKRTYLAHNNVVCSVACDPSGRLIASGSRDGTICLWSVDQNTLLKVMKSDRPYEGIRISQTTGLTDAEKASLETLGALTDPEPSMLFRYEEIQQPE